MNAALHLSKYGVTVAQAKEFIIQNLDNPSYIFDTCKNFEVTASMLAEIYGGVSADDVVNFFNNVGLNGSELAVESDAADDSSGSEGQTVDELFNSFNSIDLANLSSISDLFDFTSLDQIPIDSMRDKVINGFTSGSQTISGTGSEAYNNAFDPNFYTSLLSSLGLGLSDIVGDIELTFESFESGLYGSVYNVLDNLDLTGSLVIDDEDLQLGFDDSLDEFGIELGNLFASAVNDRSLSTTEVEDLTAGTVVMFVESIAIVGSYFTEGGSLFEIPTV